MQKLLAKYYQFDDRYKNQGLDLGLLFLRLTAGGLMLFAHGMPKLLKFPERYRTFADPLGVGRELSLILAVFGEVVCSLAVMLGLFTRLAAFPVFFTMLVAAFVVHAADPWSKQEFALVYGVIFAALMALGGGRYSLDAWLRRKIA